MMGYYVQARDGDVGQVSDLLVDPHAWRIEYLLVHGSPWFNGHRMVVAPTAIRLISWVDHSIEMALPREALKNTPSPDAAAHR